MRPFVGDRVFEAHCYALRRFNAGQSQEVVGHVDPPLHLVLDGPPSLPQVAQEEVMIEKVVAVCVLAALFGLIHYRNFYWRSSWERMTRGLR